MEGKKKTKTVALKLSRYQNSLTCKCGVHGHNKKGFSWHNWWRQQCSRWNFFVTIRNSTKHTTNLGVYILDWHLTSFIMMVWYSLLCILYVPIRLRALKLLCQLRLVLLQLLCQLKLELLKLLCQLKYKVVALNFFIWIIKLWL